MARMSHFFPGQVSGQNKKYKYRIVCFMMGTRDEKIKRLFVLNINELLKLRHQNRSESEKTIA